MTAESLAAMGHHVVLCSDAQIVGMVTKDSMVLLGCDRIGKDRFRNKVGSLPLVLAARYHKACSLLVSGSEKLADTRIPWFPPHQESPTELWKEGTASVEVNNRYFEDVPFSLIDRVFLGGKQVRGAEGVAEVEFPVYHEKTVRIIGALLASETPNIDAHMRTILEEP
jgi:translation initiation factor 2B subunit (eIF-2B alpha/beta/delta family)